MRIIRVVLLLGIAVSLLCASAQAGAAKKTRPASRKSALSRSVKKARPARPARPAEKRPESAKEENPPVSYICIEADSGLVLAEANADLVRPPASMVKMMLMLLVAEGIKDGRWTLDTPITVSRKAEHMGGSQIYLKEGEVLPLGNIMNAIAVVSANDGAIAVAEGLWGSEEAYLARMNQRAQELGMRDTKFNSVHGLPPDAGKEQDRTTARDMVILAQWCVRDPVIVEWTKQQEMQFRPGEDAKYNTNKLLWRMANCDGLKTGYTWAAGFCVTATARRNGVRLVAVVMGHNSVYGRFNLAEELLEKGFAETRRVLFLAKGQEVDPVIPVRNCETQQIRLVAADEVWVTVREQDASKLHFVLTRPEYCRAPTPAGAVVGEGQVQLEGQTLVKVALAIPRDLKEAGWRWRLVHTALPQY